jgi:exodeoxyribonuclease VII small subunit
MLARMGNTSDIASLSFEEALKALEDIVRRLESGEAPLDESIDLYARGDALRAHCQKRLDAAQARIEAIVSDGQGRAAGTKPFDDAAGGA